MNSFLILFCNTNDGMKIFSTIGKISDIIMIVIPIILILMGTIDFLKAVMAQKDDDMKKTQSLFIKRVIYAVIIFFVPSIVGFIMSLLDEKIDNQCMICFNTPEACTIVDTTIEETSENEEVIENIEDAEETTSKTGSK